MAPVDTASNPAKTPIHPEVEGYPANPFSNAYLLRMAMHPFTIRLDNSVLFRIDIHARQSRAIPANRRFTQ
jgi:hypothetical protein